MATELIACPRCGASPAGPADPYGQFVCPYCASRYRAQPQQRLISPALARQPPRKQGSQLVLALALVGGVLLIGAAALVVAWSRAQPRPSSPAVPLLRPTNEALVVQPAPTVAEKEATATFEVHSKVPGYQSSFYLLGFVTNTSPFTIEKPKLTAVLLDKSGKEVATKDGFADSNVLPPKATVPFKLLVSDPPPHDRYTIEIVARKASYVPEQAGGLRLEILEQPHPKFGKSWEATGKVFNDGGQAARFVKINVLAFDEQNKLVGLDYTYVDGERLAAGASARFRAMPLYNSAPHHFKFEVSGRPDK